MITEEDVRIENIDTEGTPPCDVYLPDNSRCGKPSYKRVHGICLKPCGNYKPSFMCKGDIEIRPA